eukprot:m.416627 g.416627  ORF g.416627 m.416627 type:complete len:419 (-) comp16830_c1_seq28:59-1315(-)
MAMTGHRDEGRVLSFEEIMERKRSRQHAAEDRPHQRDRSPPRSHRGRSRSWSPQRSDRSRSSDHGREERRDDPGRNFHRHGHRDFDEPRCRPERDPRRSPSRGDDRYEEWERRQQDRGARRADGRDRPHSDYRDGGARQLELADPPTDADLRAVNDDPRSGRAFRQTTHGRKGRNTESFDPRSTFVRPDFRVRIGPNVPRYNKPLKHDDVVVVPEFFCAEDDWSLYYRLVEEMRAAQSDRKDKSEWIPWHEGCHLISKGPEHSPTFKELLRRAADYFGIEMKSVGTRFNWYRDDKDWKPFHHDSAAFNPGRARNQNITVGISLGGERELAFIHAATGVRAYFPQSNGMMFSFGRDTNIKWKHGINAVPESEYTGKGRISIILWGKAKDAIEEDGNPPLIVNSRPSQGRGRGGRGGGRR